MMKKALIWGLVLLSGKALAIANSQQVRQLLASTKNPVYERILQASGLISYLVADPLEASSNEKSTNLSPKIGTIQQGQCSAIHFQEPAFFLTAAHCLVNEQGKRNEFSDYAKVFVNGKAWKVDPVSVWIPKEYEGASVKSRYDLAVFAVAPSQEAEFDRLHSPIEIIPSEMGLILDQEVYVTASGATSSAEDTFGEVQVKPFFFTPPDLASQLDPTSPRHIRPDEEVLSFTASSPGVNCSYDSGGGVIVELETVTSGKPVWFLLGLILGTTREANEEGCEKVDRYLISSDLRTKASLIDRALSEIAARRQKASEMRETERTKRVAYYQNPKSLDAWAEMRPERLEALLRPYQDPSALNERYQFLFHLMQEETIRQSAASLLVGRSGETISAEKVAVNYIRPYDPFDARTQDRRIDPSWRRGVRGRVSDGSVEVLHAGSDLDSSGNHHDVVEVRVRNIGGEPISYGIFLNEGYSFRNEEKVVLQSGAVKTYKTSIKGKVTDIKKVWFLLFKGDPKSLRVDFKVASSQERRESVDQIKREEWEASKRQQEAEDEAEDWKFIVEEYKRDYFLSPASQRHSEKYMDKALKEHNKNYGVNRVRPKLVR